MLYLTPISSSFENTITNGSGPVEQVESWNNNRYHRIDLKSVRNYMYIINDGPLISFSANGCEEFFEGSDGMCGDFDNGSINYGVRYKHID